MVSGETKQLHVGFLDSPIPHPTNIHTSLYILCFAEWKNPTNTEIFGQLGILSLVTPQVQFHTLRIAHFSKNISHEFRKITHCEIIFTQTKITITCLSMDNSVFNALFCNRNFKYTHDKIIKTHH